jgi:hypothetical protein
LDDRKLKKTNMTWTDFKHWYGNNRAETWTIAAVSVILMLFFGGTGWVIFTLNKAADEAHSTHPVVVLPVKNTSAPVAAAPEPDPVYDPPCGPGSDAHFCTAPTYKKWRIHGTIWTVEYKGETPFVDKENHLEPDYTEVHYYPPWDGAKEETVEFCGNVLDKFTPGKQIDLIANDSKMSDYNGCYDITVTERTFGGKPPKVARVLRSTVPGSVNQ